MLLFDPPELEKSLAEAINAWTTFTGYGLEDFGQEIYDVLEDGFDKADFDDATVTPETTFRLALPGCEDGAAMTYGDFVELAKELPSAQLVDNQRCWTDRRLLVMVEAASAKAEIYMHYAWPDPRSEDDSRLREVYEDSINKGRKLEIQIEKLDAKRTFRKQEDDAIEVEYHRVISELLLENKRRDTLSEQVIQTFTRYCITTCLIDGAEVSCSLLEGFSIFGVCIVKSGDFDDWFPPVNSSDLFVEIRFENKISEEAADALINSYLFELSASMGLDFILSRRPEIRFLERFDPGSEDIELPRPKLRPLLFGKGMTPLLELYNRAAVTSDFDIQILFFTKVVEYVSQTVVRMQANEAILQKLNSPKALSPDSQYIQELESLVLSQRVYHKDQEAIKLTVLRCCDALELARLAPPYLDELRKVSSSSKAKEQETALAKFALCMYSTRNQITHAKANYTPTGLECPKEEMRQFSICARLAAQQVIRWYHTRSESIRVI